MTTKRSIAGGAFALVLACFALLIAALPSSAAEQDIILALSDGTIGVNTNTLDLPNGDPAGEGTTTFQGTWDDETGDLAGTFTFPPIATVSGGFDITLQLTQTGGGTGNVDPATGLGTVSATLNLGVSSPNPDIAALLGTTCGLGPIDIDMDVTADLAAMPPTFAMTAGDFTVPAAAGCGAGGALNPTVNAGFGITGANTSNTTAVLNFAQTNELPPPPVTPPTTPTPPAVAPVANTPAARPVAAQPTFTG